MNILSLDGGVAITLHLRWLRHLELARPGFLSRVELFAGAADGGLAAILLAALRGSHEENLRAIDRSIEVFHEIGAILRPTSRRALAFAREGIRRSIAADFEQLFARSLGARLELGDLERAGRKFVVPTYETSTWRRRVFRSFNIESDTERRRTLVDLALMCTATIPVLPPHRSPLDGQTYLDGAYITNNPTLIAVREACTYLQGLEPGRKDLLGRLRLLSLGATERAVHPSAPERGLLKRLSGLIDPEWELLLARFLFLPDFLFQGSVDIIDLQCAELLGPQYHRVRAVIPELEWLVGLVLFPEKMRRQLDLEAERRFGTSLPELAWVDAYVLAQAAL